MTTTTIRQTSTATPWGFFGTAPIARRRAAASAILAAVPEAGEAGVRAFLDSDQGRHFAEVIDMLIADGQPQEHAIATAVEGFKAMRIDRRQATIFRLREGDPYLDGWVRHHTANAAR